MGARVLAPVPPGFGAASGAEGNAEWVPTEAYHAHRIALGVPEAGRDFPLGDTFPHEADLDLLNGISFSKGCFVGQENTARMNWRQKVNRRLVVVEGGGGDRVRIAYPGLGLAVIHARVDAIPDAAIIPDWLSASLHAA